jgi:tRNA-binding protein
MDFTDIASQTTHRGAARQPLPRYNFRMTPSPAKPAITPQLLEQVDIRVGTIESVEDIASWKRLVKLRVHFGDHHRDIVAGLKQERANPQEIVGRQTLFVVNLEPR